MAQFEKLPIENLQLPRTLDEARSQVLSLPGADNYVTAVPDRQLTVLEIDQGLENMTEQVLKQLDAENMRPLIENVLGWSETEAAEFFSHPDRQPYRSQLELSKDFGERAGQFLVLGTYLKLKYMDASEEVKTGDESNKDESVQKAKRARENLRMFLEFSSDNLFSQYVFEYADQVNGINPSDRKAGTIHPSEEILNLLHEEAEIVASSYSLNTAKLYQDVLAATEGGNFTTIFTFLSNNKGAPEVRRVLEASFVRRVSDLDLAQQKLQLVWLVETYRMAMGVDLDFTYELGEYPDGATIEAQIHEFLTNQNYVDNTLAHLRREAAPVAAAWEDTGQPMNYWEIWQARANFHNLPDSVSSLEELEAKKQRIWTALRGILPLAFLDTPLSFIDAPTRIGAQTRASNITYPNSRDQVVNVVCLNAREREEDLRETTGHELGHKLQAYMLKLAENFGYVPTGSYDRVPSSVKEEFSQLVESQVGVLWATQEVGKDEEARVPPPKGEFRDLSTAIVKRRQGPFAINQMAVRLLMEKMWHEGKRDAFTAEETMMLTGELQPLLDGWYAEGVPIIFPYHRVQGNTAIIKPDDGLVYLRKYIVQATPKVDQPATEVAAETIVETTEQPIDMKTAFESRFGEKWLFNPDARAVLLMLLAETGNEYDITTYGTFVMGINVGKVRQTLTSWGITEDLI